MVLSREISTPEPLGSLETLRIVDRLDDLVSAGWGVPLNSRVIVRRAPLTDLVGTLPMALRADLGPAADRCSTLLVRVDELAAIVGAGKPGPLSRLVCVDTQAIYRVCDEVRAGIAYEITTIREADAAGLAAASSPLAKAAARLSGWPPPEPENPLPGFLRNLVISGAIASIAGLALGATIDPYLYSIAMIGAVNLAGVALIRFWLLRLDRSDLADGAKNAAELGADDG